MNKRPITLDRFVTWTILLGLFLIGLAFTANFGARSANSADAAISATTSTPSPASLALIIVGAVGVIGCIVLAGAIAFAVRKFTQPQGYKETGKKRHPLNLWAGR